MHGGSGKDSSRAEELEGLDLNGFRGAVEVSGEDDFGYGEGVCGGSGGGVGFSWRVGCR